MFVTEKAIAWFAVFVVIALKSNAFVTFAVLAVIADACAFDIPFFAVLAVIALACDVEIVVMLKYNLF